MEPSRDISRLLEIMARLRDPESGCPWDIVQTYETIAPYTIEEAYEVADAIARGDIEDLRDELGDLLLQVVFHARMAEEEDAFDFGSVVEAICTKMIRRHPHVFGAGAAHDPATVKANWAAIKAQEKAERRERRVARGLPDDTGAGLLDSVSKGLPPLLRALELQRKAATVGFDWNDPRAVLDKIAEECAEVVEASEDGSNHDALADEVGDLFFVLVNLARHLKVDPEAALGRANAKFVRRFASMEEALRQNGEIPQEKTLNELEALWVAAKEAERR